MFNGIIYNTGKVVSINKSKNSLFIGILTNIKFSKKDLGSSISCNGVCLTLVKVLKKKIYFYLSDETLKTSNFNKIKINQIINLEKSLIYGKTISGHYAQGHVDTVAKVNKITIIDKTWLVKFNIENKIFSKYLVEKASISINGVSITLSKVKKNYFTINIIPHTLKLTNLKDLKIDDTVNVELDIFGKYIYKYSN
jgi:riboflavin synthase